jgi:hypothetical protein
MSRKLDLDLYLSKYQSDEYRRKPTLPDGTNTHRFKQPYLSPTVNNFRSTGKNHEDFYERGPDYLEVTRNLTSREQINTDFHNSQT